MKTDAERAMEQLAVGGWTAVLCRGGELFVSRERGVKPLLEWLDSGRDFRGFSAADKVVGKAAAFLYVLLGVREVRAPVMSEGAAETLTRYGVLFRCDTLSPEIRNRAGTGLCPMEQSVWDAGVPEEALAAVRRTLRQLQK